MTLLGGRVGGAPFQMISLNWSNRGCTSAGIGAYVEVFSSFGFTMTAYPTGSSYFKSLRNSVPLVNNVLALIFSTFSSSTKDCIL